MNPPSRFPRENVPPPAEHPPGGATALPWASGANRRSRLRSAVIVVSLVVAIGTVDYLTGYWFSFQLF
ncbi:MAG TPA: hypothetical protein VNR00_07020, partial [Opitutus sp.]|nr:hypothetical protein [Opitutus sp.]